MNEPWITDPIIWIAFCKEFEVYFNGKEAQLLYSNTRSMKEDFEWFKKGFISRERLILSQH